MKLTDEQLNAVHRFGTSSSLKISAFAGTGKTSTLTAIATSTNQRGLYLAFNKSIAQDAVGKFPKTVDCRTTHSIAFRAAPSAYREVSGKLTDSLHSNHIAQLLDLREISVAAISLKPRSLAYLTAKTVQRFCQSGDDEVDVRHVPLSGKLDKIPEQYQQEFREYVAKLAAHLWDRMLSPNDPAPLGHDGYLKLWSLSRPRLHYDYLLLDEAQDTNEAVLSVLREQTGHLTLVGDRHQQIYEWRGAVNAMASVTTDAEVALTRSFRFGNSIAVAANSILKVLGETRLLVGDEARITSIASSGRTGTVLCRTNAGVISVVLDALSENRTPHVIGGVNELIRLLDDVSKLKAGIPAESPEFFGFQNWSEVVELSDSEEGESLRSFVRIVGTYGESALIDKLKSVSRNEVDADLIVSTGHKAKGREWNSVTLASDFDLRVSNDDPHRTVINEEEARLLYVAATRARDLLVVPSRLAAKWNAAPVEPTSLSYVPLPHAPPVEAARPTSVRPELPSFVSFVPPPATEAATAPAKQLPGTPIGPFRRAAAPVTTGGLKSTLNRFFKGKQ